MDNTNTFEDDEPNPTGQVYRLSCKDTTIKECYIGSSINLRSRLQKHKHNTLCETSNKHHLTVYRKIREFGNWDNWKCDVLETVDNPTRSELIALERKHYEDHIDTATLNSVYCGRTPAEGKKAWKAKNPGYQQWYNDTHKEYLKEYYKEYYAENKEKLAEYYTTPTQCECGSIVNRSGIARHRRTKKHLECIKV